MTDDWEPPNITYRPPSGGIGLKHGTPVDGVAIARPGDKITCPHGHPVFNVVADVVTGNMIKSEWVTKMDGTRPLPGEVLPRYCKTCNAALFPLLCEEPRRYGLFINGKLVGEDI